MFECSSVRVQVRAFSPRRDAKPQSEGTDGGRGPRAFGISATLRHGFMDFFKSRVASRKSDSSNKKSHKSSVVETSSTYL